MAALNFFSAYPKGDQDELFALGDAWKKAATDLDNLELDLKQVTGGFSQYYTGKGADAILQQFAGYFDSSDTSLPALVKSLNALGHDARATAADIEYTKIQAEIFALLTVVAVGQLLASLAGSVAVPAYLAAAREVLAVFARTMVERIEAIAARAATRTLAKAVTKEIAIPLGERVITKAPLQLVKNSLKGGAIMAVLGAASDAGVQAIQLGEGHLDDGFDLKKTFQTSIEWGVGGLVGGPAHIKIADMLGNRGLSPRLGGLISGGLGGMAGGVGMYGGGLGNHIYDYFKNGKRIDWSFSPQLLLGGAALGGAGGLRHGIRNSHGAPTGDGPTATAANSHTGANLPRDHTVTPDTNAAGRTLYRSLQTQVNPDVLRANGEPAHLVNHGEQLTRQINDVNAEAKTLGGFSDQHVAQLEDVRQEWRQISVTGGDGSAVHPDAAVGADHRAGPANSHAPASPAEPRAGAPGGVRPVDVPPRSATDYAARPGFTPERAGDPSMHRDPVLNRQSATDSPARIVSSMAPTDNATNVAAGTQDKPALASQVSPPRPVTADIGAEIRPAPSELAPRNVGTDTPDAASQPQGLTGPQRPPAGGAGLPSGDHQPAVPNVDPNAPPDPAAEIPPSPTGSELVPTTPLPAGAEHPLEIRRRIDHITGVEPDPAQTKSRSDLRDFYQNQNTEAADVTPVAPREAQSGSPAPAYEARRFSYAPDDFLHSLTIRLHLDGVDHLPPDHLTRILDRLHATVDNTFNTSQHLLSGDRLQVRIELTDNPAEAHLRATVGDPQHVSDPHTWTQGTHPDTLARQLREHLGLSTDPSKQKLDYIDVRQLSNDIATANTDSQLTGLPRTRIIAEQRLDDLETPTHQWAVEDALRDGNSFLVGADPRTNPYGDLVNDGGPHNDGRGNNCLDNSLAALSSFYGDPQVAHPRWPDELPDGTIDQWGPEEQGNERALAWLGGGFSTWAGQANPPDIPQQFAWLHNHLSQLGEMSSALVINKWNGPGAHATVVVYPKGAKGPLWWDPQQRTISETPPASLTNGSTGLWFRALDPNEPNGGITGAGAVPHSAASGAIPGPDLSSGPGIHHPAERVRLGLSPETTRGATPEPEHAPGTGPSELRGERPDRSGDRPLEPVHDNDRPAVRRSDTDRATGTGPSDLSPSLEGDNPADTGGRDRDRVPGDRRIPDHATGTEHRTPADHQQEHPAVPNELARDPGSVPAREGMGPREPGEQNLAGNRDLRVLDPERAPYETSPAAVESGAPSPHEKPFILSDDHGATASPLDAGPRPVEPTGSGPRETPRTEPTTRELGERGHPRAELADLGHYEENPLPTTELARIEQSLPITEMVPTEEVRFSQRTVSRMTSTGVLLTDLAASMAAKGWHGGPLHAVVLDDGRIVSLDNRRLTAARMAGLDQVPTALHAPSERVADWPLEWDATRSGNNALRVDIRQLADGTLRAGGDDGVVLYRRGQIPETWGEFAQFRMADPRNPFPSDLTGSEHAPVYAAKPAEQVEVQLPAADKEYIAAAGEDARLEADLILADLRTVSERVTTDLGTAHDPLELRGEEHRLKSVESLERKYYTEREHGESVDQFVDRVNDLVRFSARLPAGDGYMPALEATFEQLRGQGYEVVDVKNFWREGNRYYGLNSTLRSPLGREFEVQFPTDTAWRVNKLTHQPYEIFRRVEEPIERRIHAFLDILRINGELGLAHQIPSGVGDRWRAVDTSLNKWTGKNPAAWQGYHGWLAENNRGLGWVTEQFGLNLRELLPNYESGPPEVGNTHEVAHPLAPHESRTERSLALQDLSREAQQFVFELSTAEHIGIQPGEVSTAHLAELQRYTGVEHAVVQNAAGELRLVRGAETTTTVPESLRGEYEFTVHTHPEERLPGPASERESGTAAATGDSMRLDVLHKTTPHIEAVVSSDGQIRFFDNNAVRPAGSIPEGSPINSAGRVVRVEGLGVAQPHTDAPSTRSMSTPGFENDRSHISPADPGRYEAPATPERPVISDRAELALGTQAFRDAAVEPPTRPHQERAADAYRLPGESPKPTPAVPERYEKLPAEAAAKGLQLGPDGLLFKENDKPGHWRSAKDGYLHEKNDRAGTYRDEGYHLRDESKPSEFAKDQNVDHSNAPLYGAQKGKETSYTVTDTTSAKALADKSIERIDQQGRRDPAGADARVHFPEFGINHINELSAKKLAKKVAELTKAIKKENISSADKTAKLDRLEEMRDNADKYHTVGTEMNKTSKTMGEIATLAYANDPKKHPNAVVLTPLGRVIDGRDTFDVPVFLRESEGQPPTFIAFEAKSLGSELGDADTPVGRAEQCSPEYYARTMMEEKNLALLHAETPETLRARGIDPNAPDVRKILDARDEMMRHFQDGTLVYKCEQVHVDINGRVTVTEYSLERDGIAMTIDNIAGIERVRTPLLELAKQRELELVRVIEHEREQILATFTLEQREIIQLTLDIADGNRSFAAAQQIILTHEALTNIVRAMDEHGSLTQMSKSLVDANDAAAKAIQLERDSRLAGLRELDMGRDAEVIKQLVGLDAELRNRALIAQINVLERELVNRAIAQTIDAREVPSKDRAIFLQHNLNLVRAIEPGAPPEKVPQLRELCDAYDSVRQVNEQERGRDAHALERMGLDESHTLAVRQALEADRTRTLERAEDAFAREIVRQASEQTRDARSQEQDIRARTVEKALEQVRELERDYQNRTEPNPVPIREVHDALHRALEQERAREVQALERLQLGDHQTQQVAKALEVEHRRDAGQTLDVLNRELQRQEHNRMFGPDSGLHIPGRAVEKFDARTYQLCRENLPAKVNPENRALVYQKDGRTIEVPHDSEARRLAQAAQELERGRTLEQVQINYALSVGQAREAEAAVRDRQTEAAQVVRARQLEAAARERARERARGLL